VPVLKSSAKIFAIFALMLLPVRVYAQTGENQLRTDVEFLSDTLCRGRGAGTGGMMEAARYVCSRLESEGLNHGFQTFPLEGRYGRNIISTIKGSGKGRVIICAHMDGLGHMNGITYPGADANASGVAALLRISQLLKESACRSEIIIAFLDGHNAGRAGAIALRRSCPSARFIISLDIIGSDLSPLHSWEKRYLIALGGAAYRNGLEKAAAALDNGKGDIPQSQRMNLLYNYYGNADITEYFYRTTSDIGPFLSAGTPGIVFTSGITTLTNKTGDLPETLNYPLLEERCRLIASWLSEF